MSAALPLTATSRAEQVFPTLTLEQIARVGAHGKRRAVQQGDILIEAGQQHCPFFVVTAGQLDVVRSSATGEELMTSHKRGNFSGELNLLTGRRSLATIRVTEPGEVIEVHAAALQNRYGTRLFGTYLTERELMMLLPTADARFSSSL